MTPQLERFDSDLTAVSVRSKPPVSWYCCHARGASEVYPRWLGLAGQTTIQNMARPSQGLPEISDRVVRSGNVLQVQSTPLSTVPVMLFETDAQRPSQVVIVGFANLFTPSMEAGHRRTVRETEHCWRESCFVYGEALESVTCPEA